MLSWRDSSTACKEARAIGLSKGSQVPQLPAFAHLPRAVSLDLSTVGCEAVFADNAHLSAHVYRDNPFSLKRMSGVTLCDMRELPVKVADSCRQFLESTRVPPGVTSEAR